ncbi:MAG: hypothetical protein JWP02_3658, partial [Acidimicrobiales bacterium]|nr:hypothetical protein [Acidimicrobiales bacterium]
MVRSRLAAGLVAVALSAGVLAACGSDDNGGVINQPTATTAPGGTATTTANTGAAPNY